jgi:hypothetical protein
MNKKTVAAVLALAIAASSTHAFAANKYFLLCKDENWKIMGIYDTNAQCGEAMARSHHGSPEHTMQCSVRDETWRGM